MMMIYVAHIDACILKASWSRLPDRTTGSPWVICSHSDSLMPGDTMRGDTFVFRLSYVTLASLTSTGVGVFSKHVACLSYCILSLYGNSRSQRTSRPKAKGLVKTQEDSARIFSMKITPIRRISSDVRFSPYISSGPPLFLPLKWGPP